LPPDPEIVRAALGKDSTAWQVARFELAKLWEEVRERPDVQLKRDLWADLLRIVYGSLLTLASALHQAFMTTRETARRQATIPRTNFGATARYFPARSRIRSWKRPRAVVRVEAIVRQSPSTFRWILTGTM
jgi:hypothetical protein